MAPRSTVSPIQSPPSRELTPFDELRRVAADQVIPGRRVVFMGESWMVRSVLYSRDFRPFFALEAEAGDRHELIAADGSDGGYELLQEAARDSDPGQRGEVFTSSPPHDKALASAVTLVPSPGAVDDHRFAPRPWRP